MTFDASITSDFLDFKLKLEYLEEIIYHPTIKSLLPDLKDAKILDAGCGSGELSRWLHREFDVKYITAVDSSETQIKRANKKLETQKNVRIIFQVMDVCSMQFRTKKFDFMISAFMIQFLTNLEAVQNFAKNSFDCLKDGGKILILFPNPVKDFSKYGYRYSFKGDLHDNTKVKMISETFQYEYNYLSPQTIMNTFESVGFTKVQLNKPILAEGATDTDKIFWKEFIDFPLDWFMTAAK